MWKLVMASAVMVLTLRPAMAGTNLVVEYGLNEGTGTTVADSSGSNNPGTVSGAAWTASGRYGAALTFDGVNDRVNVNDSASLDLTTGMTLEAWVYPTALSGWRTVALKERGTGGLAYALYAHDNAPRPAAYINTGTNSDISVTGPAALPLSTWSHLAATYDGATLRLYVNGAQVGSRAVAGSIRTSTSPFRIGGNAPWGEYFAGRIDEVRVYNRALTATEIQADMTRPVGGADTTAPTITGRTPAPNATGVAVGTAMTATFSEAMDPATISGSTVTLQGPGGAAVAASVSYSASTLTATLTPSSPLLAGTTYTAAVLGGTTDPRVKDVAGNALAATSTWTFTTASAGGCTGNPIVCENQRPGNPPSEWDISGAGDLSIQGFATDISVNRGGTVRFKIQTPAAAYRLDVYRMGYYGGMGARKVATVLPAAELPQNQPLCLNDGATGLIDCGNWAESASWTVPADAVSGIYFAKLIRSDTGGASHIVFVVRDDAGTSDIVFQTSDTTWQAYNDYGGNSLYTGQPAGRAYKVSYNRPLVTRNCCSEDFVWNAEYPMVRWLERNGYDVSYISGVDTDRAGARLLQHRLFLSVGHDEYWSGPQRANVEAARGAGVHLAFFSGNEVFWKTRWEPSIDGSNTPYRTMVSYKETHAGAKIDPLPDVWTGTWRDARFSPPADGGRPENALTGTSFMVNGIRDDAMQVPEAEGKLRFWRNTSIAGLAAGQVATLPAGVLGYEWDEDLENGARPAGLIRLSSTTVSLPGSFYLLDNGSTFGPGIAAHALTLYRHTSGALVFGAGTVQWSWGLDADHDRPGPPADLRMQQATVNLFADMGVQPGTLQAGLVAATQTTDTTAPTTVITSPAAGAAVQAGVPITISGTASDAGGRVAGVEVSVDGGATWERAAGRESWSFSWTPAGGSATILARAADDSANLGLPASVSVGGGGGSVTCPCSIWPASSVPA
ncbi:MAG: N,N-dimethylformamidase beta subunit family domain-containing protein, partial [Candidatus Methylomirabilales bacterium]